ncbi:MAG: hypothetical protein P1V51_08040 [Deltaproteobacteria bacterium]|nr:hypothetical protein [Deltaproteobacteria bacterium]
MTAPAPVSHCLLVRCLHLILLLGVVASCSAADPEADPDGGAALDAGPPLSAVDYCETIAPAFCDFYLRCGRMNVDTLEACLSAFGESCHAGFETAYVELEAAGLLAFDASALAACQAHLEAVACADQLYELTGPCAGLWQGLQPAGGECGLDAEYFVCAPGTDCVLGLDFCGTCLPLAGIDAACEAGQSTCGAEAFCRDGRCVARVPNGEACGVDDRCLLGSTCAGGTCAPPAFTTLGAPCDRDDRCPYLSACVGGRCVEEALQGATCSPDRPCASGFCSVSVCVAPRAAGAACSAHDQCLSGLCVDGACQARPSACIGG